ncbi:MAG: Gfo/Idh/MocA family oxidoreductase [Clostridia bacterium]|nr:Gfo/Idh/MocA family oxidoreductase [Clostridia bacterium]MBQ4158180.1 Gfo/Idh/MocA family oxidoreductase [Clostridia bacterium]
MDRRIRVAHFGIAHDHSCDTINCARQHPDVFEIVGVCEPDENMREEFGKADAYKDVNWISEEELLSRNDIDAVFCEGHELRSVSDAQKCIDRALPVHLDKPGGTDIKAFERLIRSAEEKQLTLQMGYMYRYNPALKYAVNAVKNGDLGTITGIDASFSTSHSAPKRRWLKQFPGGTMFFLGCHSIDMIMLAMGEPLSVHPFNHSSGDDNDGSMDSCFAVLEYPAGAACVRANSTEVRGFHRRHFKVTGTKGTIEICPLETPTVVKRIASAGEGVVFPGYFAGRYDDMMLEFAACVRGEMKNPYTGDYEIQLQKAVLRASGIKLEGDL